MKSLKILIFVSISLFISCFDKTDILKAFVNQPKQLFKTYYTLFEKHNSYNINSHEGLTRFTIFQQNLKKVEKLNNDLGKETFGFTPFMDMTHEEFKSKFLMKTQDMERLILPFKINKTGNLNQNFLSELEDFEFFDKLGPIKTQKECGSCWAFAVISVLESKYMKLNGVYREFSEQYLVDCDDLDNGCKGGWPTNTLKWIFENGVQDKEIRPYTGIQNSCGNKTKENNKSLWIINKVINNSYIDLPAEQRKLYFLNDLKKDGPFVVVMDGGVENIELYKPKNIDNPLPTQNCKEINHAVTAVGKNRNLIYVRNSWGSDWGFNGYFSVSIDQDCFITNYGFGAVVGDNLNTSIFKKDEKINLNDDNSDINDNQTCAETFFINCDFVKKRKLKNCDYFTNADEHFGKGNQIKGMINETKTWYFFDDINCKGNVTKYGTLSKSKICFEKTNKITNLKSGYAASKDLSQVKNDQVLLTDDYCFGGNKLLLSNNEMNYIGGEKFVPRSAVFSSTIGNVGIVRGIVVFEEPNFQGKRCNIIRLEKGSNQLGNVNCELSGFKSYALVNDYPDNL